MYSEETSSPQRTHEGGSLRVIFRPHQIARPVKQNKRAHRKPQESSEARKVLGFFSLLVEI